jgi:dihydroorotase
MSGQELKELFLQMGIKPATATEGRKKVVCLIGNLLPKMIALIKQYGGKFSPVLQAWYMPASKPPLIKLAIALASENGIAVEKEEIKEMIRTMELKSYSVNTIRIYRQAFSLFLDHIYPKAVTDLSKREIEEYLLFLAKMKNTVKQPYILLPTPLSSM